MELINILFSIFEKILFFIPKRCIKLDLILERLENALNEKFHKNDIRKNAKAILDIGLFSEDHFNGIKELEMLKQGNYRKQDKKDLSEIIILYKILLEFERNNDGKTSKKWNEINELLNKANMKKNICEEIIERRRKKG